MRSSRQHKNNCRKSDTREGDGIDMAWPFSNPADRNGANQPLGLGLPNNQQTAPVWGASPAPAATSPWASLAGGITGQDPSRLQAATVAPPSEMELIAMLLHNQAPVDRWLMGPNMQLLLSILSKLMTLSITEYFRHARFTEDEEGRLMIDQTSLPTELQTISGENVMMDATQLQANANHQVQQSLLEQQQILAQVQAGMMQGMLDNALADPGFMERMGQMVGGVARGATGMR